jgi:RNA polymerase sigma-54 factor
MELRQEVRLRQEQILQPQQILRSELIQLPILELELRVRGELEENPFLEETDEELQVVEKQEDEEESSEEPEPEKTEENEIEWEDILNDDEPFEYRPQRPPEELVEIPRPHIPTLTEHLQEQLHLQNITDQELDIGEYIIGNINADGYLDYSLEGIATDLKVPLEQVEKVLELVQAFDPAGIGARNLRECLLIQLNLQEHPNPTTVRILEEGFDDFINKRYESITKKLDISVEDVRQAFEDIRRLNPKPGEGYFDEKQNYIIPDLVVQKVSDEFVVYLSDGNIPNFHINNAYRNMILQGKKTDKKIRDFVTKKLESARWFINAIHQRRTTILRTMRAIVKKQQEFFEKGKNYLKPMILNDIAEEIGMDISTISRVTNGKYVQTDWGVFELKYFFSERMETSDGEEVSTKIIKSKLRDIIDNEDKSNPLSDQAIAELLEREGFPIARRTVQKYREQMNVPVRRMRREI